MNIEYVSYEQLSAMLVAIFRRAGTSEKVAQILGHNCASAERDGSKSHGLFRIPGYLASLRSGWVNGTTEPVIDDIAAAFLRVDAKNGFAQPALARATPALTEKARRCGIALLAIRDSHHFAALWLDVEPFARQGFIALTFVNGFACVTPYGGRSAVFGTNPLAFAVPRLRDNPFVFDQATSTIANGEVRITALDQRALPPGCGVDKNGEPTVDPRAVLEGGALLPFGGHKGASIMMMVEILAAALTGGQFSFEVDWSGYPGAETPRTGQLVILIDPQRGAAPHFVERLDTLFRKIKESGQQRLPSERRYALRKQAAARGIPVPPQQMNALRSLLTTP